MLPLPKPLIPYGWLRACLFYFFFLVAVVLVARSAETMLNLLQKARTGQDEDYTDFIQKRLWLLTSLQFIAAYLSVWLFRTFVDRSTIVSLGFTWKGSAKHAWTGAFSAIAMLGVGTGVLMACGYLSFGDADVDAKTIATNIFIMAIVAVSEELIVRGYILNNLMQSFDKYTALLASAAIFACLHLGNPGMGWLPIVELFIGGVMLGINYIYTKNLWFGIFLHFFWNFLQGPVLGYEVSGIKLEPILQQHLDGPEALTGGLFGFEGSVLAVALNLLLTVILWYIHEKKTRFPVLEKQVGEPA